MNGILLVLIILRFLNTQLRRPLVFPESFWWQLRGRLLSADYRLAADTRLSAAEEQLLASMRQGLRTGWGDPETLAELGRLSQKAESLRERLESLAKTYVLHLGLSVLLPLILSLGFEKRYWFSGRGSLTLAVSLLSLLVLSYMLQSFWPRPIWSQDRTMLALTGAWLWGEDTDGAWREPLRILRRESLATGEDAAPRRHNWLKSWWEAEQQRLEARLRQLEDALGPAEFCCALLFGSLLLGPTLLSYFSRIAKGMI